MQAYEDHIGLWRDELRAWVPAALFDAHVHVGPPEIVGPVTPERQGQALSTFTSFTAEALAAAHAALFQGCTVNGMFAFPFPQREVDLERANDHMIELMLRDRRAHGLMLSDPENADRAVAAYEKARARGVPFRGVKPYADRLGKNNFAASMPEFVPADLLAFMDEHRLIMMLHTAGWGVGDPGIQAWLRETAERYPRVPIVLAHLGRYVRPEQFMAFMDSGVFQDCPSLYLEMSSASVSNVYGRILSSGDAWRRLLFGTDLPFGLITGIERWSDERGAIFLARDDYSWTDPAMNAAFAAERDRLTYNTYHVIKAFKDAIEAVGYGSAETERIKQHVFCRNAERLLAQTATGEQKLVGHGEP